MAVDASAFTAEVSSVAETERGLDVRVRLRNVADRSIHYIARPRALHFDAATSTLTIRLTDEGRMILPGAANVHPTMSYLDPGAEAELVLSVPAHVSQLAPPPDDERRKVAFVRERIADAAVIRVEIGWADTPFYAEQRPGRDDVFPSVLWEQHRLTVDGVGRGAGARPAPGTTRRGAPRRRPKG